MCLHILSVLPVPSVPYRFSLSAVLGVKCKSLFKTFFLHEIVFKCGFIIACVCVCVQSAGFTLEIQNTNAANVMVGLRVLVGSQTTDKAPSYLEIFGRTIQVSTVLCLPMVLWLRVLGGVSYYDQSSVLSGGL